MRRIAWGPGVILGLSFGLLSVVSCEEDDSGPSAEDAPEVVANEICKWHFECGCDQEMNTRFTSRENCELSIAADVQEDIDRGEEADLVYAPDCVQTYLQVINAIECSTTDDILTDTELAQAWQEFSTCKLFYGMREAGQSCTVEDDNLGDTCLPDLQCRNEVCVVPEPILVVGEECEPESSLCESGLLCLDVDADGTAQCESLPRAGDTCLGMADLCDVDFYCAQESKTCTALPGPGQECAPFASILAARCNAASVCNLGDDMCEPVPEAGEACVTKCAEGLRCQQQVCVRADPIACLYDGE